MYSSDGFNLVQASRKDGNESQWSIIKRSERGHSFENSSEEKNKEEE